MDTAEGALRRVVPRWQIVGLALNDVIGSGVYLLPAAAAALLGPSSIVAILVAGAAVLLLVLCFAEASTHFDGPGGAYLYSRSAFGDFVGFEVGWMTWVARVASVASLSVGFAQALSYLWPEAGSGVPRSLAIALPILLLTWLNMAGVRSGVTAAMILVASKIIPLVVFAGAGLLYASVATVRGQAAGSGHLGEAALLLMFAYAGFENTPAPAGEFRNPQRDIPFALVTHIIIVTVLYVAVQWVALGTLPSIGSSVTPLADAAGIFLGPWAGLLLTVGAALSILGTNSNTVLAGPRYLYALAREGYGPRILATVHPRWRTPAAAILTQTIIALPLALTGTFVALAALSVVARLASYLGTAAAVPILRRKMGRVPGAFRLPWGPLIPLMAAGITLGLAASATPANLLAAGGALLVGGGLYALRRPAGQ